MLKALRLPQRRPNTKAELIESYDMHVSLRSSTLNLLSDTHRAYALEECSDETAEEVAA